MTLPPSIEAIISEYSDAGLDWRFALNIAREACRLQREADARILGAGITLAQYPLVVSGPE